MLVERVAFFLGFVWLLAICFAEEELAARENGRNIGDNHFDIVRTYWDAMNSQADENDPFSRNIWGKRSSSPNIARNWKSNNGGYRELWGKRSPDVVKDWKSNSGHRNSWGKRTPDAAKDWRSNSGYRNLWGKRTPDWKSNGGYRNLWGKRVPTAKDWSYPGSRYRNMWGKRGSAEPSPHYFDLEPISYGNTWGKRLSMGSPLLYQDDESAAYMRNTWDKRSRMIGQPANDEFFRNFFGIDRKDDQIRHFGDRRHNKKQNKKRLMISPQWSPLWHNIVAHKQLEGKGPRPGHSSDTIQAVQQNEAGERLGPGEGELNNMVDDYDNYYWG